MSIRNILQFNDKIFSEKNSMSNTVADCDFIRNVYVI